MTRFVVRETRGLLTGSSGGGVPGCTYAVLDSSWLYEVHGLFRNEDEVDGKRTRAECHRVARLKAEQLAARLESEFA